MIFRLMRLVLVLSLVSVLPACALSLRNPSVAELRQNPGRYHDRTVTIEGTVTDAWGLPLVPFKMYKVDDGTGEVTVLSQNSRMPARGERVRVKGRVNDVALVDGQAVGLHLREEALYVKR